MGEVKKNQEEKEMSFLEHLEELRWHIIRSLFSIIFFAIVVFLFKDFVFEDIVFAHKKENFFTYRILCNIADFLCFGPPNFDIVPREFGEKFFTHLKVSFWMGITISIPYIFYELWRFIKPGLYKKEQKAARGMVTICSSLFILGIMFGFFIIAPFAIKFLAGYSLSVDDVLVNDTTSLASYVNYLTMFTIPTGFIFELPVIVYFLSRIGLLTPSFMRKYRRHSVIVILIFAAIITPPEVITQILIGIPVLVLYEISIFVSKRAHAKYSEDN
ncbi:MAG: twin-arginine translocase subunit TatC [Saprospiraceae bacterium]|nr:twin-arginine translocase subunit TatC [Bacteroidia bacterium]NNL91034.1 twin-arginine translocase subunit TatC [Saprospiraceae bacterium]